MSEFMAAVYSATAQHAAWAPAGVFAVGVLSSFGPCVAPRFVAVAGLAGTRSPGRAVLVSAVFVAGLATAYALLGLCSSLLGRVAEWSSPVYACTSAAMFGWGAASLLRADSRHAEPCSKPLPSLGAAYLLGGSFALSVSPCCAPLVAGIIAYTSSVGQPTYGALLLAVFAVGHASPALALGPGVARAACEFSRRRLQAPTAIVSGAMMLAMGGYCALII